MLLRTRVHYLLCYANSGQLVVEFWASKVFQMHSIEDHSAIRPLL